jgi:exodeoxyribonuclease V beta subunit
MQTFDILNPETNILGNRFLEASAGTGKTFAIEHVAARLLLEETESISIDQILILTFTRAATRELKNRVHRNLQALLQALETRHSSFDYLKALLNQGEETICTAIRKIQNALACFEEAQIFTIHGFCHRMLSEFAFEANVGFSLQGPDSKAYRRALRQIIDDVLHTHLKPSFYSPRQIHTLLHKYAYDIDALKEAIITLIEKGALISEGSTFEDLHAAFCHKLSDFSKRWTLDQAKLRDDFAALAPCYKKMLDPKWQTQLSLLGPLLEKGSCDKEAFDTLLGEKTWFFEEMGQENLKVRAKLPEPSSLHYIGVFEALQSAFSRLLQTASDPLKTLLRLSSVCQKKWLLSLETSIQMPPDEILQKMERCLEQPAFLQKVRQKYRAAIVDEFQDTDPLQWKIFHRLFLKDSHATSALYLVGDPKQSIYAFRKADVYTYLKAKSALGNEGHAFLTTNFRSDPSLVHALNLLFSSGQTPTWLPLPALEASLDYVKVEPSPEKKDRSFDDGKGSLHFFLAENRSGREKKIPSLWLEETLLFPFIIKEISWLRQNARLPFSAFCILVKDRFQAQRLQTALKRSKIPASLKRSGYLTDSAAFWALQELLEAACQPKNLSALKIALAGPLIGWSSHSLHAQLDHPLLQKAFEQFQVLHQILKKRGFACFFQAFLETSWHESGKTVLEHLLSQEEISFYSHLRQLSELLIEEEAKKEAFSSSILTFLKDLKEMDPEEEERLKIRPDEDRDCVSIMTIHMSKGLEFDIVFALGLASRLSSHEEFVRLKIGQNEQIELFDLENEACLNLLKEQDAEKMRQLYVALTRAKRRVYIPCICEKEAKQIPFGLASPIELFLARQISFCKDEIALYEAASTLHMSTVITALFSLKDKGSISFDELSPHSFSNITVPSEEVAPTLSLAEGWQKAKSNSIFSFTSLSHKSSFQIDHSIDETPSSLFPVFPYALASDEKNVHTLPLGAETGVLLHRIFEKVIAKGLHHPFDETTISQLISQEIRYSTLKSWHSVIVQLVNTNLHLPLITGKDSFALVDIPPSKIMQEMEFLYSLGDNFMKGFIDLAFERGGKYYLLDYKSNWLGSNQEAYTQEALEQAMKGSDYFLQGSIYRSALERYVKLFDNRPFEECFGGCFYLFLRGNAPYHFLTKNYTGE